MSADNMTVLREREKLKSESKTGRERQREIGEKKDKRKRGRENQKLQTMRLHRRTHKENKYTTVLFWSYAGRG